MEVKTYSSGTINILSLKGRFDSYTVEDVRGWLEQIVETPQPNIVINLSEVNFLDSTALSALVLGMKQARERQGDLRLCGLQQPVRLIFELTRLDRVFEIFATEADAVQAFHLGENNK